MMNTTKTAIYISFEDDADSTSSQEDELKIWIECIKRSAREADGKMLTHNFTNCVETWEKLKCRQALGIATQSPDRWSRKAAEWNLGLNISTRSQRRVGRSGKRWEDDLNEFVKYEETQTTQSNDLKNNNTCLTVATKIHEWEKKEKQYTKHVIDD